MNARGLILGVWVVGAAMVGAACGPTDSVEGTQLSQQEQEQDNAAGSFCGGFANVQCPRGYTCVDDPSDTCDPAHGGRDCGGLCAQSAPACGHEPGYHYVLTDPAKCAGALFKCAAGQVAFFNDCGCGCKPE